jgi:hypothetical protein
VKVFPRNNEAWKYYTITIQGYQLGPRNRIRAIVERKDTNGSNVNKSSIILEHYSNNQRLLLLKELEEKINLKGGGKYIPQYLRTLSAVEVQDLTDEQIQSLGKNSGALELRRECMLELENPKWLAFFQDVLIQCDSCKDLLSKVGGDHISSSLSILFFSRSDIVKSHACNICFGCKFRNHTSFLLHITSHSHKERLWEKLTKPALFC